MTISWLTVNSKLNVDVNDVKYLLSTYFDNIVVIFKSELLPCLFVITDILIICFVNEVILCSSLFYFSLLYRLQCFIPHKLA